MADMVMVGPKEMQSAAEAVLAQADVSPQEARVIAEAAFVAAGMEIAPSLFNVANEVYRVYAGRGDMLPSEYEKVIGVAMQRLIEALDREREG